MIFSDMLTKDDMFTRIYYGLLGLLWIGRYQDFSRVQSIQLHGLELVQLPIPFFSQIMGMLIILSLFTIWGRGLETVITMFLTSNLCL
jgi:hypothetical protein